MMGDITGLALTNSFSNPFSRKDVRVHFKDASHILKTVNSSEYEVRSIVLTRCSG